MTFVAFGHQFSKRVDTWRDDLRDLEREAATYQQWILDDQDGGPGVYRVTFAPSEVYRYVRAVRGWDEYLLGGFEAVTDHELAREAEVSAAERDGDGVCAADFLGDDVEALVCGWRLEKAQKITAIGSNHEPIALLHQIASGLPTALNATRRANEEFIELGSERDLQDLLYVVLRCAFEDVRREEWMPSHAGSAKRVDLVIPSERILVETKFVRDKSHAKRVVDELKVDFESYHAHPACNTLFALIWDPERHLRDGRQIERDLTGTRSKAENQFEVAVRVA